MQLIFSLLREFLPDELICMILYEYSGLEHPVSSIIRTRLIDIDTRTLFRFKRVCQRDVNYDVSKANAYNPLKNGFNGYYDIHHDDGFSFFFHRDYDPQQFYNEYKDNPEYLYSEWKLFEYDGRTKYWDGSTPNYPDIYMYDGKTNQQVPIEDDAPDDETPHDRDRRITYYTKEKCVWSIKAPSYCNCSGTGTICLKRQEELYRNGHFDDMYPSDTDEFYD
jgi:hypothetical protein